ncbi:hypothetical protein BO83DRAFT_392254 [Aspergillus eucalypticola CBS 122712]|uniref:Uncharacterized protein n=1 Tax=Aspergillus eucalypticola (strain CBS 122712 / IBT 29274) TaxID=1448314 RepID=A0A317USZ2_ASPEC|nr:uncharacterized protein BO83DRAFT_392254 [Aspergillus eucalypticola CBS 122712]PWY65124.1 hypothetical protein BO83DRAFT_392254 [Aspergillus eucalypticola CBS 122712]
MGWAAVVDIGDPALSPPASQALVWVHTVNQASVGWLGRAWDIGFNIRHTGSLQRTRPRLGGWDGPGTSDTGGGGFGSSSTAPTDQALVGWLTAVVDQASVGRLGWAWDIGHGGGGFSLGWVVGMGLGYGFNIHNTVGLPNHSMSTLVHCSGEPGLGWVAGTGLGHRTRRWGLKPWLTGSAFRLTSQQTKPWMGGRDGLGLSDSTSNIRVHCSGEPQTLVGWLGWAWDNNSPYTTQVHCSGEQGPGGWQGRAWDIGHGRGRCWDKTALSTDCRVLPDKHIMPWLGGWDGLGISTNPNSTQHRFTTAVDQASAGRLGRAWDIGSKILILQVFNVTSDCLVGSPLQ